MRRFRVEQVRVVGFRALTQDEFGLQGLNVFHGPMGSGKTSRLLALYYALTGATPPGVNLDELIHVEADFMWVEVQGWLGDRPFTLVRRKRRGQASSFRSDPKDFPPLPPNIYVEGRDIARLFARGGREGLNVDELLGLNRYREVAQAITTGPIDRQIRELERQKESLERAGGLRERLRRVEEDLTYTRRRLEAVEQRLREEAPLHQWAEEVLQRQERMKALLGEVEGKRRLVLEYKAQLQALRPPAISEEEVAELEAKRNAAERRIAFLEAVMQAVELQGQRVEEIALCPLCGAFLTPEAKAKVKHYYEEYRRLLEEAEKLSERVREARARLEEAKRVRERASFLEGEISRLEKEVAEADVEELPEADVEKAQLALKLRDQLLEERRSLELELRSLEEQESAYKAALAELTEASLESIDRRLERLRELKERLQRVKVALMDVVREVRDEELAELRSSFQEAFKTIYPYQRLAEVDFETVTIRGRETLTVKARTDGGWIYSHQMSTGENVAVSFALLFAVNRLGGLPILLLDEPEEGLDEKGVEGLAQILFRLKESVQLVVATRSPQLARLLSPEDRTVEEGA
jgi:DNA repair exonuclease SbcCD ATPase subunit